MCSGPAPGRGLRERADGGHPHEPGGLRAALAAHPGHLRPPAAGEGLHRLHPRREWTKRSSAETGCLIVYCVYQTWDSSGFCLLEISLNPLRKIEGIIIL